MLFGFVDIVQSQDVRVLNELHDRYFAFHLQFHTISEQRPMGPTRPATTHLQHDRFIQFFPVDYFHCHFATGFVVNTKLNKALRRKLFDKKKTAVHFAV